MRRATMPPWSSRIRHRHAQEVIERAFDVFHDQEVGKVPARLSMVYGS